MFSPANQNTFKLPKHHSRVHTAQSSAAAPSWCISLGSICCIPIHHIRRTAPQRRPGCDNHVPGICSCSSHCYLLSSQKKPPGFLNPYSLDFEIVSSFPKYTEVRSLFYPSRHLNSNYKNNKVIIMKHLLNVCCVPVTNKLCRVLHFDSHSNLVLMCSPFGEEGEKPEAEKALPSQHCTVSSEEAVPSLPLYPQSLARAGV